MPRCSPSQIPCAESGLSKPVRRRFPTLSSSCPPVFLICTIFLFGPAVATQMLWSLSSAMLVAVPKEVPSGRRISRDPPCSTTVSLLSTPTHNRFAVSCHSEVTRCPGMGCEVTAPACHRSRLPRLPIQTSPLSAANTDEARSEPSPSDRENVTTRLSRKQSRPFDVATQRLP